MKRSLKVLFHFIGHAFPDNYMRTMVWKAELEWGSMTYTILYDTEQINWPCSDKDSSPVILNWENRCYSATYAGHFVCDSQRSTQDFYFCHSPSHWERGHVEWTKSQLVTESVSLNSVTESWMISFCLRSDQFLLTVQSLNNRPVFFVGCSLWVILHNRHCMLVVPLLLNSSQKFVF